MSFFGRLISSLTGNATPIPNFDFDFKLEDPDVTSFTGAGNISWSMRDGRKVGGDSSAPPSPPAGSSTPGSGDGNDAHDRAVTVFSCSIASGASLVQNATKRAKSLVAIPGVLRTLGTAEYEGTMYIATERCVPLRQVALNPHSFYRCAAAAAASSSSSGGEEEEDDDDVDDQSKFEVAVSLGLFSVAGALGGLHRNSLVHLNVNLDSVFVLPESGEWKLFGFELCGPAQDVSDAFVRDATSILPAHRVAPEFGGLGVGGGGGGGSVSASNAPLADAWCLGMLMLEVFIPQAAPPRTINDIRAPKGLPRSFFATFNSLVTPNVRARWGVDKFRNEAEIVHGNRVVDLVTQLDELNLKNSSERDTFYRDLAACMNHLPDRIQQGQVLPKISSMLQYGGSSASALTPLLRIARKLPPESFAAKVSPAVLTLFSSNEPVVRMLLLEHSGSYAHMLPPALVCEKLWPLYSAGLSSKLPEIREQSVRALPNFAPVLGERFQSGDVAKALIVLQQDAQGAIRANTTLCLAMVAKYIPQEQRAKTLCNGLGRMLKDPFVPSRLAAVRAIGSLASAPHVADEDGQESGEGFFPPQMLCEMLIPAVSPMLIDPDTNVRNQATTTAQALFKAALGAASQVPCTVTPPPAPVASSSSSSSSTPGTHHHQHQQHQQPHHAPSSSSSANTTPAVARSPVAPTERNLVFGAGKPHPHHPQPQPEPVAVAAPKASSNTAWDDAGEWDAPSVSKPVAVAAPAVKRGFKAGGGSSGSTGGGASSSSSTADIQAIFGHTADPAPPAPIPAPAPARPPPVQQQQPDPEPVVLSASTSSMSASSGGMKLGAPKKRGFGIKDK